MNQRRVRVWHSAGRVRRKTSPARREIPNPLCSHIFGLYYKLVKIIVDFTINDTSLIGALTKRAYQMKVAMLSFKMLPVLWIEKGYGYVDRVTVDLSVFFYRF